MPSLHSLPDRERENGKTKNLLIEVGDDLATLNHEAAITLPARLLPVETPVAGYCETRHDMQPSLVCRILKKL